jgi:hypothetical protein
MALLNLANGISAAGTAISQTAGSMALAQQKSDLDSQLAVLGNQLATARETGLAGVQAGYAATAAGKLQTFTGEQNTAQRTSAENIEATRAASSAKVAGIGASATLGAAGISAAASTTNTAAQIAGAKDLATIQEGLSEKSAAAQSSLNLSNIPLIASANAKVLEANASDPKYIAAQKTMVDSTATPEQRAQAAYYTQQAASSSIASAATQEVNDARAQMEAATKSGDPEQLRVAQQRMFIAQYSAHDEVQRAATLTAQVTNNRLAVIATQGELDKAQQNFMANQTPGGQAAIDRLTADLAVGKAAYATSQAMAQKAANELPSLSAGPSSGTKPPLSSFDKGIINTPATPGP